MSVAGVVLAAGRSTRLTSSAGAPDTLPSKLLLPYGEGTVVEAAVAAPLAADLTPVIAVLGHRANAIRRALVSLEARIVTVENPAYGAGISSSLAAGVRIAESRPAVEGVAVLLADEPGMLPEWIRAVVTGWRDSEADIARAFYLDRPGHPVVFGRALFDDLRGLRGDEGASALLRQARHAVCSVRIGSPAPVDVDTERDYRDALRRREEKSPPG